VLHDRVIQREEMRAKAFNALSSLFYFPHESIKTDHELFLNLIGSFDFIDISLASLARELYRTAGAVDYQKLAVEFTRLFIGPFGTIAPPYGSFYMEEGRLMGDSTLKAMDYYISAGLTKSQNFKDLPDHISAELEFVYYLISNETTFLKHGALDNATEVNSFAESFLKDVLLPWVRPFAERIKDNTDHEYFKNLADCLVSFSENCSFDLAFELRNKN